MATTVQMSVNPSDLPQGHDAAEKIPGPGIMVIFGASGDLTKRKLLPALFHLEQSNLLPKDFAIVGVARRPLGNEFAEDMKDGILKFGSVDATDPKLEEFVAKISYHALQFDDASGYPGLKDALDKLAAEKKIGPDRLFYLATAPEYFAPIIENLGASGMAHPEQGKIGVVIEKPFGHDLDSARELNRQVNAVFPESQVFRIDHYLGKETVQNVLAFRFANGIFEPVWNRNFIDNIQITAAEDIGIEGRGPFYEKAGALRDIIQNHMMEVLGFVTMEPPSSFEAEAVRREKVKVWQAIPSIPITNAVRGQYGPGIVGGQKVIGYREEERVNPESGTETYAAVKLEIENWRWAGVPFYLRAGKRLKKRATEITIQFKQPPLLIFNRMQSSSAPCPEIQPNIISIRIQPDDGIALRFGTKVPNTPGMTVCPVNMDFSYAQAFGQQRANGYERLLLDAMLGDQTLFSHRDGVEINWAHYTPILQAWAAKKPEVFPNYFAGSWGPDCSDRLLEKDGRKWKNSLGKPE
ncbi:glucose-6-phosphate dehydrogenase [Terracidiphilus gabretensis]|uniref:glucose-6-phosphate dehydrogenase n=1 Tax=Terracidiphilus gabretensis TaxID=1577687 RepID=UPI000AD84203|nr:glucose-6-phosphate dehydrogenase [Terracidiphilus gabretensis]